MLYNLGGDQKPDSAATPAISAFISSTIDEWMKDRVVAEICNDKIEMKFSCVKF